MRELVVGIVAALALAGCSQLSGVPDAEAFPDATLRKIRSAEHWNVIAEDVVAQTALMRDRVRIDGRPIHVSESGDYSDFSRGFRTMLISRLVGKGLILTTKPEAAITVAYEVQVVRHRAGHGGYQPGTVAALAGGMLVAREIAVSGISASGKAGGAALVAAGIDLAAASIDLHSSTNTEVIVTTSFLENDKYLMRKTDVYYVDDSEGALFEVPPRAMKRKIEVVGK